MTDDLRAARRKGLLENSPSQGQPGGYMTKEGNEVLRRFVEARTAFLEPAMRAVWGRPAEAHDAGGEDRRQRTLEALRWLDIDWVDIQEPEAGQRPGAWNSLRISWGEDDE